MFSAIPRRTLLAVTASSLAILAGAIGANSAQATVWKVGGTTLASGESRNVTVSRHPGSANLVLSTKALGAELVLEATGIKGSEVKIDQKGTVAHSNGKLIITGVSVAKPAGCKVASELTTEALEAEVVMGNTEATKSNVYERFGPVGEKFLSLKIEGCAASNTYPMKGNLYGLAQHTEPAGTFVNNTTGQEFGRDSGKPGWRPEIRKRTDISHQQPRQRAGGMG